MKATLAAVIVSAIFTIIGLAAIASTADASKAQRTCYSIDTAANQVTRERSGKVKSFRYADHGDSIVWEQPTPKRVKRFFTAQTKAAGTLSEWGFNTSQTVCQK